MTFADRHIPSTSSAPAPERVQLSSLQVMRGLAAISVAIYHTHLILAQPRYGGIDVLGSFAGKCWIGVNFFFVLSGFIIPYAHHGDIGRPRRALRYVSRRLTRVYPIYWLFLTLFLGCGAIGLIGGGDIDWSSGNLVSAYLLIKLVAYPLPPLKVAWTLFYEVYFYAAFLLLILNRAIGTVLIAMLAAAIALWGPVLGHDAPTWYVHSWNLYFVVGALGFIAYRRFEGRDGLWIALAGLVVLMLMGAAGWIDDRIGVAQSHPRQLIFEALPFAMILVGGALADRARAWNPPAMLALLGEASYAIYLVHSPAISALAVIQLKLARHQILLPPVLLFILVAIAAVTAGVAAHILVERPLLRLIRRPRRKTRHDIQAAVG
jgi:peptidoglycan/LPS O-acetylase OafA/YrhL